MLALLPAATPVHAQNLNVMGQPQQQVHFAQGFRGAAVPYVIDKSMTKVVLPLDRRGRPTYSSQSGYRLSVDATWPGPYGYRPVVFTLRRQKPAVADERITIQFSAGDWYAPKEEAINVTQHFVFPVGATTASHRVLVPRYQDQQQVAWKILVDGRSDDYLAVKLLHLNLITGAQQAGSGVVGLGLTPTQIITSTAVLPSAVAGGAGLRSMGAADLPTDWREFSSLDIVIMPAADVEGLANTHPQQLDALLRWVHSGGNLWLLQAGDGWENLPAVEQAVGVERNSAKDGAVSMRRDDAVLQHGWQFPAVGQRSTEASQGALLLAGFDTGQPKQLPAFLGTVLERFKVSPWARQCLVRGHGFGVIAAFREDLHELADRSKAVAQGSAAAAVDPATGLTFDPATGVSIDPVTGMAVDPMGVAVDPAAQAANTAITQSLLGPRTTWASRHGNQPDSSNFDFNNLLIAGVGMAPVGQFQFLVTLFAVAIGPLNYWLLKRSNKLPMLLATVPLAAAGTTLLLFMYGLFADGFSVRARCRTLTLLDQKAGEVVSWGRLSYYAGIAPRDGLSVPSDQLMYPIMPSWLSRRWGGRATSAPRHLEWQQEQLLSRGWLASRTPTQYHAITTRPSTKRLDMRVTDDGLRIDNRLGVDVTHLAVEGHDGRFYWCEDLPSGNRKVVAAAQQNKLLSGIRKLFTDNLPENPAGDDYGTTYGYQLAENLMEGRLSAINDPAIRSWGRGKYIAFTNRAVELDLGLDDVREEASFHVIEGTW